MIEKIRDTIAIKCFISSDSVEKLVACRSNKPNNPTQCPSPRVRTEGWSSSLPSINEQDGCDQFCLINYLILQTLK